MAVVNDEIRRVRYFDRQFLRASDFQEEQAYHIALRRRHNIAGHTWGIVVGLALEVDGEGNLSVAPGLAIDGFGRELVVSGRRAIAPDAFDLFDADALDVWLEYDRVGAEDVPSGYYGDSRAASTLAAEGVRGAAARGLRETADALAASGFGSDE